MSEMLLMDDLIKTAIESTQNTPLSLLYEIMNPTCGKSLENPLTVISPLRADEHLISLGLAKKIYSKDLKSKIYYSSVSLAAADCRTCEPYFRHKMGVSIQQPYFLEAENTNYEDFIWQYPKIKDLKEFKFNENIGMYEHEDMSPIGSLLLYYLVLYAYTFSESKRSNDKNNNDIFEFFNNLAKIINDTANNNAFMDSFLRSFQVLMERSKIPSTSSPITLFPEFRAAFQGIVDVISPVLITPKPERLLSLFEYNPSLKLSCPIIECFYRYGPYFEYIKYSHTLAIGLQYFLSISQEQISEQISEQNSKQISEQNSKQLQTFGTILNINNFFQALKTAVNLLFKNRIPSIIREQCKQIIKILEMNNTIEMFKNLKSILCFNPKKNELKYEFEWIGTSLMEVLSRGHNSFIYNITPYLNVPIHSITDIEAYKFEGFDFKSLNNILQKIIEKTHQYQINIQTQKTQETIYLPNKRSEFLFRSFLNGLSYTYIIHPLIAGPSVIMEKQSFIEIDKRMEAIPEAFEREYQEKILSISSSQKKS